MKGPFDMMALVLTSAFMAPAFLLWSYPGLFSRETYTNIGSRMSTPVVSISVPDSAGSPPSTGSDVGGACIACAFINHLEKIHEHFESIEQAFRKDLVCQLQQHVWIRSIT